MAAKVSAILVGVVYAVVEAVVYVVVEAAVEAWLKIVGDRICVSK
jgi:hypothetical protein